ncbi:hypothetical protein BIV57_12655 [Mangrovactinospora gilvigrisea]|uniref:Uncharacterized protein n=1 Tax=Mangrovactinospora gilvigrisea TaxID=1428644 RepID=A0A1J7C6K9_9ACTN|nr:hypothetical protein [Mangrovactinospora gilvigrisea]OIV37172.1 hypothetical protein BIV57_12655 [Mangrovactinospora gilvigrisea]
MTANGQQSNPRHAQLQALLKQAETRIHGPGGLYGLVASTEKAMASGRVWISPPGTAADDFHQGVHTHRRTLQQQLDQIIADIRAALAHTHATIPIPPGNPAGSSQGGYTWSSPRSPLDGGYAANPLPGSNDDAGLKPENPALRRDGL